MEWLSCSHLQEALQRQTSASTKNLSRQPSSNNNVSFDDMMLRMEAEGCFAEASVLSRRSSSTRSPQGSASDAASVGRFTPAADSRHGRNGAEGFKRLSSLPERLGSAHYSSERMSSDAMGGCEAYSAGAPRPQSMGSTTLSSPRRPSSASEHAFSRRALIEKTEFTVNNILINAGAVGKLTERPQPAWKPAEFDEVDDLALFRDIDVLEDTRHRPSSVHTPSRASSYSSLHSAALQAIGGGGQGAPQRRRRRPSGGSSSSGVTHSIVQNILDQADKDGFNRNGDRSSDYQAHNGTHSFPRPPQASQATANGDWSTPRTTNESNGMHILLQPSAAGEQDAARASNLPYPSFAPWGDSNGGPRAPASGPQRRAFEHISSAALEAAMAGSVQGSEDAGARASNSSSYLCGFMDKLPPPSSPSFSKQPSASCTTFRSVASILSERAPQLESCSMKQLMKTSSTAFGPYPFSSEEESPMAHTAFDSCHSSVATRGSVLRALRTHRGERNGAGSGPGSTAPGYDDDLAAMDECSGDSEDELGVLPLTANSLVLHDKVHQRNPTKEAFWDRFWSNIAQEAFPQPAGPPSVHSNAADHADPAATAGALQQFARNLIQTMTDTHAAGHATARSLLLRRDPQSFRRAYTETAVRESGPLGDHPQTSQSLHSRRWTCEAPALGRSPLAPSVVDERSVGSSNSGLFRGGGGAQSPSSAEAKDAESDGAFARGLKDGGPPSGGASLGDLRVRSDLATIVLGASPGGSQHSERSGKSRHGSSSGKCSSADHLPQMAVAALEPHSLLESRKSVDVLCPELGQGAGAIVAERGKGGGEASARAGSESVPDPAA